MRVKTLILLFLLGCVLFFWFRSENQETSKVSKKKSEALSSYSFSPPEENTQSPAKKNLPPDEKVIQPLRSGPKPVESEKTKGPQIPKGLVEFEIKEGKYAVAFGDILLGTVPEEKRDVPRAHFEPPPSRLWPSAEIPYAIAEGVPVEPAIRQAIEHFHQFSPVRFVPYDSTTDEDVVVFAPSEEICASQIGRAGGQQVILVSRQCGETEIIHELMHSLGFVHEHSREDRDQYLDVLWSNIKEEFWLQFQMVPESWIHEYRGSVFDFDPESIMLYPPTAFVKRPGLVSLKSKRGIELRPSRGLSSKDRERLYYLYGH